MKLIVGLGNPGYEYYLTPHNLGFMAVDRLAENGGVDLARREAQALTASTEFEGIRVVLAKPETFMNLSGLSVRELVAEHQASVETDLIVLQDELDFPLGILRLHRNRSSAGHNGIESLIGALGTQDFLRIRMGVAPQRKVEDGMSYLLSPMRKAELRVVDGMLEVAAEAVTVILTGGEAAAMNRFNRKPEDEKE